MTKKLKYSTVGWNFNSYDWNSSFAESSSIHKHFMNQLNKSSKMGNSSILVLMHDLWSPSVRAMEKIILDVKKHYSHYRFVNIEECLGMNLSELEEKIR